MPITADINPGELWHVAGKGLYVFEKEASHNVLLFRRERTGFELRMPEYEFYDRLDKGKIERIHVDKNGDAIKHEEVGPGEAWTISGHALGRSARRTRVAAPRSVVRPPWRADFPCTITSEENDHEAGSRKAFSRMP
jgi:hypothetical protein